VLTMARTSPQAAASSLTELIISTTGSWKGPPDGEVKVADQINEQRPVEQVETGEVSPFQAPSWHVCDMLTVPGNVRFQE
jgi:hypothetical protein